MNLQCVLESFLPLIEEELRACVATPPEGASEFFGMMQYHMGWRTECFDPIRAKAGKRVRPLFTLLACQAAGAAPQRALPAAAAVEIIHNFSLVHDDIEDRSDMRRGRRTVWSLWGEAQAINVGDGLFALAHLALHRLPQRGVPPERVASALRVLNETCLALCQGQHRDMAFEHSLDVDAGAYLAMIRGKTAALLSCAARLGALVATDDATTVERYGRIGETLGLAFQIQDDVLGVWGDAGVTGKPVADDIRSRKKTLPVVYVLGRRDDMAGRQLRTLYTQSRLAESQVAEAVAILDEAGARAYAERLAGQYLDQALCEIEAARPEPEAGEALRELAHFLVQRAF
jgi:geranylgeranyl diphosphate synthase type I